VADGRRSPRHFGSLKAHLEASGEPAEVLVNRESDLQQFRAWLQPVEERQQLGGQSAIDGTVRREENGYDR